MDDENIKGKTMPKLQIALTLEVNDKQTAETKLQQLKNKLAGTGVKLSASYLEMLQKPEDQ